MAEQERDGHGQDIDLSSEDTVPTHGSETDEEQVPEERLRTTSYSEIERTIEEKEGRLAARTPEEMSLHDELSRTPTEGEGSEKEDEDAR